MRTWWPLVAAALVTAATARAELHRADPVVVPAAGRDHIPVTRLLYLDRCVGGCAVHGAVSDDADTNNTSIPPAGDYQVSAFQFSDAEWHAVVACVQAVYSPYDVTITDVKPSNEAFNKSIVAGMPGDLDQPQDVLGIALIANDCHPLSNAIAFAFANAHPHDATFVDNLCWTVAQESAHLYGLEHEYVFTDGASACSDPMTYRNDCGGEKFFRPRQARCGRVTEEPCKCGKSESSHGVLMERFGPGTPTTPPPTIAMTSPTAPGSIEDGAQVVAHASAVRGVDHVDLVLNGFVWATVPGAPVGRTGQPEADYTLELPADVPDGVIDVVVRASDDLGAATSSAPITVTKGEPCRSADTCAAHQACDDGRCHWAAPSAELGDACTYAQECTTATCEAGACTQACDVEAIAACPDDFACHGTGTNTQGLCVRSSGGAGCCDSGGGAGGPALLAGVVLAAALRRRRP